MKWKLLRRDFVDSVVPCRLGKKSHNITSGVAYVIEDENGHIAYCGPVCAKNEQYVINPHESVPDFTIKMRLIDDEKIGSDSKNNARSRSPSIIEYLRNKKADLYLKFLFIYIPLIDLKSSDEVLDISLACIVEQILNGQTEKQISKGFHHILLDVIDTTKGTKYDLDYILFVYAYMRQIDFLMKLDGCSQSDSEFLQGCKNYVIKHHSVSEKQFVNVVRKLRPYNRTLKYICDND